MSKNLCVYTCITGDYDTLHEINQPEPNVDYLCFTNNKSIKSKTWKIIYIEDSSLNNHLLSRKIKILGHPIISEQYDASVWMDASVIWNKKITAFVSEYFKNSTFSAFTHHARTSIQQEAITCLRLHKDSKENIVRTLDYLKKEEFPDNLGLYEMTVFIKKHNDPIVIKTMQIWFDTIKHYSKRDQLSFTYAIWKTNLKVSPINLSVWNNQWFTTVKHTTHPRNKECCVYYGNPNQDFDINKFFTYPYHRNKNIYSFEAIIPNDTKEIEFNPTNLVGASYSNISITPSPMSTPSATPSFQWRTISPHPSRAGMWKSIVPRAFHAPGQPHFTSRTTILDGLTFHMSIVWNGASRTCVPMLPMEPLP